MKKVITYIIGFLAVSLFVVLVLGVHRFNFTNGGDIAPSTTVSDYKNTTYSVAGKEIRLVNGISETEAAPGSASKIITQYFGNEAALDLNGDGKKDVVFLLTQTTGGSGLFYYVVAGLTTPRGYIGSKGILLGDRITPQTTNISKGNIVVVNYADRKPGESFGVPTSVGKSLYLLFSTTTMDFGEVVQNFEGETDPSRMILGMKKWDWVKTQMNDGKVTLPKKFGAFSITFSNDGKVTVTTDCNSAGGLYEAKGNVLTLSPLVSTKMFCGSSQEGEFLQKLGSVSSYLFTSKGELILETKMDSGIMVFK